MRDPAGGGDAGRHAALPGPAAAQAAEAARGQHCVHQADLARGQDAGEGLCACIQAELTRARLREGRHAGHSCRVYALTGAGLAYNFVPT